MNDTTRFLKRIFIFTSMLPLVWFVFIAIWATLIPGKYTNNVIYSAGQGFMHLRLQEADSIEDVEVLIVGSSHAYRGIDTRQLDKNGIKAFNLGSSLQSPVQTALLLKRYLKQMNPKVVLFEVGYKTFSSNGVEGAVDLIVNSDPTDWDIIRMAFEVNDITVYNSLVYTLFRKKILGETREEYLDGHKAMDRYVPGGFVERKSLTYVGPSEFNDHVKPVNPVQKRSFEQCLDYLRRRGVKTILIQAPILYDYYTSIENVMEYDRYFREKSSGDHYYNFSDSVYAETKYFYDHHHLNAMGVRRFNNDLIDVLLPHLDVLTRKD